MSAARITPGQRRRIRQLREEKGLDGKRFTVMDRRLGIPDSQFGDSVDGWLDAMSLHTANEIIQKLEKL